MVLTQNWPLFFMILVPVIILLYLLKHKTTDQPFSSLFLWREVYENIEATKPWEVFRNNLLMILQILVVAVLIFALTGPFVNAGERSAGRVVIVIDTSGSMNMQYQDGMTRFEQSVAEAVQYVDGLGGSASVSILSVSDRIQVEAANITDKSAAKQALEKIQATDKQGALGEVLSYVSSMAAGWDDYQTFLYSDTSIDLSSVNGTFIDMNSVGANAAIDYLSYADGENGMTVMAKVSNPSPEAFESDISLYLDDELIDIGRVALAAEESQVLYFQGLNLDGKILKAELSAADLLAQDNVSYAILEQADQQRILLVTSQNVFLENALEILPGIQVHKAGSLDQVPEDTSYDLYIYDGVCPDQLPDKNVLLINPYKDYENICETAERFGAVTVRAREHEVTRYMESFDFAVSAARGFEKPAWSTGFLEASGYSCGYIGEYGGRKIAVLGFDIHDSDFPLLTSFPIFIHNLVSQCVTGSLVEESSYPAGGRVILQTDPAGGDVLVSGPAGLDDLILVTEAGVYYDQLNRSGLYTFVQESGGETREASVNVAFPAAESVVSPEQAVEASVYQVSGDAAAAGRDISNVLIWIGLILLLAEWLVYIRRI